MLLKSNENENDVQTEVDATTKLSATKTSTYSKKFGTHFSITPTSSVIPQPKSAFRKPFQPPLGTTAPPIIRQKNILSVVPPKTITTPIQKKPVNATAAAPLESSKLKSLDIGANDTTVKPNGNTDSGECICERPQAIVICKRCGNELYGRVQRICAAHPKRICLMDQRECVNSFCRSIHLSEVPLQ